MAVKLCDGEHIDDDDGCAIKRRSTIFIFAFGVDQYNCGIGYYGEWRRVFCKVRSQSQQSSIQTFLHSQSRASKGVANDLCLVFVLLWDFIDDFKQIYSVFLEL